MKDQYLLLVFAFSFMAAYRLTIGFNLRAVLQMALFAIPLTALVAEGEEGVTGWAYACLGVAVTWWFADLYMMFREARIVYHGRQRIRIAKKPAAASAVANSGVAKTTKAASASARPVNGKPAAAEPEKVQMVSLKPSDIQYGPVIGLVEERPIYEWIRAAGREGQAEYVGILGRGAALEDNDLVLPPGLVYRWNTQTADISAEPALETA